MPFLLTCFLQFTGLFLLRGELIFAYTAHGTLEIVREILKLCSGLDAGIGIAEIFVIDVTAHITHKFCHGSSSIKSSLLF